MRKVDGGVNSQGIVVQALGLLDHVYFVYGQFSRLHLARLGRLFSVASIADWLKAGYLCVILELLDSKLVVEEVDGHLLNSIIDNAPPLKR